MKEEEQKHLVDKQVAKYFSETRGQQHDQRHPSNTKPPLQLLSPSTRSPNRFRRLGQRLLLAHAWLMCWFYPPPSPSFVFFRIQFSFIFRSLISVLNQSTFGLHILLPPTIPPSFPSLLPLPASHPQPPRLDQHGLATQMHAEGRHIILHPHHPSPLRILIPLQLRFPQQRMPVRRQATVR